MLVVAIMLSLLLVGIGFLDRLVGFLGWLLLVVTAFPWVVGRGLWFLVQNVLALLGESVVVGSFLIIWRFRWCFLWRWVTVNA